MKKKKENENKIRYPQNLNEATGVKVARLFYAQTSLISDDVLRDDNICEEAKKEIFTSNMQNFDDLSEDEKQSYIIAASCGWQCAMGVLRTLLALNENNKQDGK
jgi:hypothetical protein